MDSSFNSNEIENSEKIEFNAINDKNQTYNIKLFKNEDYLIFQTNNFDEIFENEFIGKFDIDSFKNNNILNKCNSIDEIFEIFNDIISSNKENQKLSNIIEETNQLLLIIPFLRKEIILILKEKEKKTNKICNSIKNIVFQLKNEIKEITEKHNETKNELKDITEKYNATKNEIKEITEKYNGTKNELGEITEKYNATKNELVTLKKQLNEKCLESGIYFICSAIDENYCIDINDQNFNLIINKLDKNSKSQQFIINKIDNINYTIIDSKYNRIFDVYCKGTSNCTKIFAQNEKHYDENQKWMIEKVGNYYSIITRLTFNQAIDIPSGNLQTQILFIFTKHNCINQLWKFIKVNDNEI